MVRLSLEYQRVEYGEGDLHREFAATTGLVLLYMPFFALYVHKAVHLYPGRF